MTVRFNNSFVSCFENITDAGPSLPMRLKTSYSLDIEIIICTYLFKMSPRTFCSVLFLVLRFLKAFTQNRKFLSELLDTVSVVHRTLASVTSKSF